MSTSRQDPRFYGGRQHPGISAKIYEEKRLRLFEKETRRTFKTTQFYNEDFLCLIEQFSITTLVITVANQNRHKQSNKPIKTRNKYM